MPNERLDDLLAEGLQIIQSDEVFSFSLDAVLLAKFCAVPPRGKIVDLCSGTGVIPLLLSRRTQAHISGVEIQPLLADMASRSVRLNGLEEQISMVAMDLREYPKSTGYGSADLVTVNPPYLPVGAGTTNDNRFVASARHELDCTLTDVVQAASRLLRTGGKFAMIHRPSRLADIFSTCSEQRLAIKRLQFVHPKRDGEANMVLLEALKDGKADLRLLPPLIVHGEGANAHAIAEKFCDE